MLRVLFHTTSTQQGTLILTLRCMQVELRATARDMPLYASLDVAGTVRMWQRWVVSKGGKDRWLGQWGVRLHYLVTR